jgi:hypothetical protein
MRTIRLQIAASPKHCGLRLRDCQYSRLGDGCRLFEGARKRNDEAGGYYFDRLPECIAAEKEAGK